MLDIKHFKKDATGALLVHFKKERQSGGYLYFLEDKKNNDRLGFFAENRNEFLFKAPMFLKITLDLSEQCYSNVYMRNPTAKDNNTACIVI